MLIYTGYSVMLSEVSTGELSYKIFHERKRLQECFWESHLVIYIIDQLSKSSRWVGTRQTRLWHWVIQLYCQKTLKARGLDLESPRYPSVPTWNIPCLPRRKSQCFSSSFSHSLGGEERTLLSPLKFGQGCIQFSFSDFIVYPKHF